MKDSAAIDNIEGGDGNRSNDDCSYESAVNALLSPGIHQATTKEEINRSARRRTRTVSDMRFYWKKILRKHHPARTQKPPPHERQQGRERPLLIHVTGTKGKGSTACMCEAILRQNGYATGLFTSPHLIDIRERIRWNGKPIHESIFADVYWKIRRALESDDENGDDNENDPPPKLPGYFRMLTLMGMYTFLHELSGNVDAIVLEVGMGGRYDATNFLDASTDHFRGVANGVTLLDLDHTRILGDTLEKIAWEKGGIFSVDKLNPDGTSDRASDSTTRAAEIEENEAKPETSEAVGNGGRFLSPKNIMLDSNTQEVATMMKHCARIEGKGGDLCLVDATGSDAKEALQNQGLSLGLAGRHQYGNAALAVALCNSVAANANTNATTNGGAIEIDSPTTLGALASAKWPGRCQTLEWTGASVKRDQTVRFYLDGAHTRQSLEATVDWLRTMSTTSNINTINSSKERLPILVFNCSHERNPVELLELFLRYESTTTPSDRRRFSKVYFAKSDSTRPSPVAKASAESLLEERGIRVRSELLSGNKATRTWQETLAIIWKHLTAQTVAAATATGSMPETSGSHAITSIVADEDDSIRFNVTASQVLKELQDRSIDGDGSQHATQVFVTGSLYLVGSFLTALEWSEESSPPL
jgi:folylpolyglutamate synthase